MKKKNIFREAKRVAGLTEKEFEREMRRVLRRYNLLQDVRTGNVQLTRVVVTRKTMTWTVRAKARTYVRYIAPKGWKHK